MRLRMLQNMKIISIIVLSVILVLINPILSLDDFGKEGLGEAMRLIGESFIRIGIRGLGEFLGLESILGEPILGMGEFGSRLDRRGLGNIRIHVHKKIPW